MPLDTTLERLLWLDGQILEVGGGYWVRISARLVPVSPERPHGIDYSLCLLSPTNERMVCYDNAHPIKTGTGPAKKKSRQRDHVHKGKHIDPYGYTNAEALLVDFWNDVYAFLKQAGIP